MPTTPSLNELKNRQLVWRARQNSSVQKSTLPSGYTQLDNKLNGGWPKSGVIEIYPEQFGIGELRLILPVLAQLNLQNKLQAWVNPPARITPQSLGVNALSQTILASPHRVQDHYWVVEQLLASACCSCLVFWTEQLSPTQAKRFQLAAKNSQTLAFIIRTSSLVEQSLAVSLRMKLRASQNGLNIDIFKRQHAWPIEPFTLDLKANWPQLFTQNAENIASPKTALNNSHSIDNVIPFPNIRER